MPTQFDAERWSSKTGCRVFPVPLGTKIPTFHDWLNTASDSSVELNFYFDGKEHNIGGVLPSGLMVVDPDAETDYLDGELTRTLTVKTPGGVHYYYRVPYPIQTSIRHFGPDIPIDILGKDHMVIGPGSVSEKGQYYILDDAPIAELPRSILERLTPWAPPKEKVGAGEVDAADVAAYTSVVQAWPEAVWGVGGDDKTYKLAAKACDFGLDEDTVFDLLWTHYNPRCVPPWSEGELRTKVYNGLNYGRNRGHLSTENQFGGVVAIPQTGMNGYAVNGSAAPSTVLPRPPYSDAGLIDIGNIDDVMKFGEYAPASEITDQPWLVRGLIGKDNITMFYGKQKTNKSFMMVILQMHLVLGGKFGPWDFGAGGSRVLVFSYEDSKLTWRQRTLAALQHYYPNVDPRAFYDNCGFIEANKLPNLQVVTYQNRRYVRNTHVTNHIIDVTRRSRADVLIIDPAMAALGVDLVDNQGARSAMDAWANIATECNAASIFTHHAPKANTKDFFGGVAIGAAMRSGFLLERVPVNNKMYTKLTHETVSNARVSSDEIYMDVIDVHIAGSKMKDDVGVLVIDQHVIAEKRQETLDKLAIIEQLYTATLDSKLPQTAVKEYLINKYSLSDRSVERYINEALPLLHTRRLPSGTMVKRIKVGNRYLIVAAIDADPVTKLTLNVPPGMEDLV